MTSTTDTTLIDEAVIDGLRPQARRYDVAVSDELVLAVLPNGAKTWTWVYDGPGPPHRQTLGVYPDMSLDQARRARESAAQSRRETEAPTAYVIRDGRIEPSTTAKIEWKWQVGGAVVLLAAGLAFGWWLLGDRDPAPPVPDDPVEATVADEPAETLTLDTRLNTGRAIPTESLPAATRADAPTAADVPAPTTDRDADTRPVVAPPSAQATEPPPPAEPDQAIATMAQPQPQTTPDSPADAQAIARQPEPASNPEYVLPAPATRTTATAAPPVSTQDSEPSLPAPAPDATAAATVNPVIGARLDPQADFAAGVTDARVARAQVTTAVVGREPVDALGPVILGSGEDIQTYYFFTELRSLAGQRIRHRWIAGDRIQAEIPFDVGEAWRWRVFSSKRLLASMAGPWRVQVLTDDDTVIYDYAFEFQP